MPIRVTINGKEVSYNAERSEYRLLNSPKKSKHLRSIATSTLIKMTSDVCDPPNHGMLLE